MTSVLFVRLSAMGDLVQGLGAIQALRRARPEWRLSLVTQSSNLPLLEGLDAVARTFVFERRGGLGALRRLRAQLRTERFDVALDLQGNWKSALVTRCSGARESLGAAPPARQESASRFLLGRTVDIAGVPHPARIAWQLVRQLAPEVPFTRPWLRATKGEIAAEAAVLRGLGIDPGVPFRILVATDPGDPRALRTSVIAAEVRRSATPTLVLVGPGDHGIALPAQVPVLRHGAGALRRLVALGALVAAVGGEVLGPDQGASHVLAAAGAPIVVLFGAQDPRRTGPPAARALVHPLGPTCRPCARARCGHPEGVVCMDFSPAQGQEVPVGLPDDGAADDSRA